MSSISYCRTDKVQKNPGIGPRSGWCLAMSATALILWPLVSAHANPISDTLSENQPLRENGYLRSKNGAFVAVMQNDGNFVVYRGTSLTDISHGHLWAHDHNVGGCPCFAVVQGDGNFVVYHGTGLKDQKSVVWASDRYTKAYSGPYVGIMQDDGNFVVYHGRSGDDRASALWATGVLDPVTGYDNVTDLKYDLSKAKILKTSLIEIHNQVVNNDSDQSQTSTIQGSKNLSEQSDWSDTISNKVGFSENSTIKVPEVFDQSIQISYEHEESHTTGGSVTKSQSWDFSTPITVPAHSHGKVVIAVSSSDISVPYNLTGTVLFQSGARMPDTVSGIYTGTNSYDMTATYSGEGPDHVPFRKLLLQKKRTIKLAKN